MKNFSSSEFSTIREHEEFIWLHDRFVEHEDYAGYIVSFDCSKNAVFNSKPRFRQLLHDPTLTHRVKSCSVLQKAKPQ